VEKRQLRLAGILLAALLLFMSGCTASPQRNTSFNFSLKYGINARNEIDTYNNQYTKDMVVDPSVTIGFILTQEDMDLIYTKMVEIDFFNYPEHFSVEKPKNGIVGIVTPYSSYYFNVKYGTDNKELWWDDEITNPDAKATSLRELITLIKNIIQVKEEYKALPEPSSGYL
jgi:hypothetical protein